MSIVLNLIDPEIEVQGTTQKFKFTTKQGKLVAETLSRPVIEPTVASIEAKSYGNNFIALRAYLDTNEIPTYGIYFNLNGVLKKLLEVHGNNITFGNNELQTTINNLELGDNLTVENLVADNVIADNVKPNTITIPLETGKRVYITSNSSQDFMIGLEVDSLQTVYEIFTIDKTTGKISIKNLLETVHSSQLEGATVTKYARADKTLYLRDYIYESIPGTGKVRYVLQKGLETSGNTAFTSILTIDDDVCTYAKNPWVTNPPTTGITYNDNMLVTSGQLTYTGFASYVYTKIDMVEDDIYDLQNITFLGIQTQITNSISKKEYKLFGCNLGTFVDLGQNGIIQYNTLSVQKNTEKALIANPTTNYYNFNTKNLAGAGRIGLKAGYAYLITFAINAQPNAVAPFGVRAMNCDASNSNDLNSSYQRFYVQRIPNNIYSFTYQPTTDHRFCIVQVSTPSNSSYHGGAGSDGESFYTWISIQEL